MTPRLRILVTDRAWPDTSIEQQVVSEVGGQIVEPADATEPALIQAAADVDAIATNWARVSDGVIRSSPRCRVIARFGIGVDNIAVSTATDLGIPVVNCPDYCVSEVSDHALGLLLACARRIGLYHLRTKRGDYNAATRLPIQRIAGQTLGLVGLGSIARTLVPKGRALGLNVVAHSRTGDDHGTGVTMVSFAELLTISDYISIHAPLTPQTRGLFNARTFASMKPTAYVINTSRGGLIDHSALFSALQRNQIAGAALDVFDPEPPDLNDPLFQDERVICTPHAAFISEQAVGQMRTEAMQNIVSVLSGRRPVNLINPQIYSAR